MTRSTHSLNTREHSTGTTHSTHTRHTHSTHTLDILDALSTHSQHTLDTRQARHTRRTLSTHTRHTRHTLDTLSPHTRHSTGKTHSTHTRHTHSTYSMHTHSTHSTHSRHSACTTHSTHSTHSTYSTHSRNTHSKYPRHSRLSEYAFPKLPQFVEENFEEHLEMIGFPEPPRALSQEKYFQPPLFFYFPRLSLLSLQGLENPCSMFHITNDCSLLFPGATNSLFVLLVIIRCIRHHQMLHRPTIDKKKRKIVNQSQVSSLVHVLSAPRICIPQFLAWAKHKTKFTRRQIDIQK